MGRRLGSKNKPKNGNDAGNGADAGPKETRHDNVAKEPLTDEQRHALVHSFADELEPIIARKNRAVAEIRNVYARAKGEKITKKELEAYIEAGTEEGQARLREQAERLERIARWREFPLGKQAEMFDEGPPQTNRSFRAGKEAGMSGEPAKVPEGRGHDPNEWLAGHQAGQALLLQNGIKPTGDAPPASDPEFN